MVTGNVQKIEHWKVIKNLSDAIYIIEKCQSELLRDLYVDISGSMSSHELHLDMFDVYVTLDHIRGHLIDQLEDQWCKCE